MDRSHPSGETQAVVLEGPFQVGVRRLRPAPARAGDVVVEVAWSGVSAGTERLIWNGRMPDFPGMGYPLVPGYEAIGRIVEAEASSRIGEWVFAPGSRGFLEARALFGGAARRIVVEGARAIPAPLALRNADGVLLALAATAQHAIAGGAAPDLIVGHGALGRVLARLTVARGDPAPVVWEQDPARRGGAEGYSVIAAEDDPRTDYRSIYDASGADGLLDRLIPRLARGGEVVLAGFYERPVSFAFPPAFMREARLRIAAEFTPADVVAVVELVSGGRLSLAGVVSHRCEARAAPDAYRTAFEDRDCLKMALSWEDCA